MKILVTGANGQLGRELRNVFETEMPGITDYVDLAELDLTDREAVNHYITKREFTHIINCAAYTAVDKAEEEKFLCSSVNIDAVKNIALSADNIGAKIIHISTDYVFDGTAHRPYKESDKVNPMSQYGTTKRAGETALLALAPNSIIIRTAWLYSPYGNNFVKKMLELGQEKKQLNVIYDQIGTPTYAKDLAQAIYKIICSQQWVEGIFNYTNSGIASWFDFTKTIHFIAEIKGCNVSPIPTEDYPTPAMRPFYSVLDTKKIRDTYNVNTPYWQDSLRDCINRINNNKI